MTDPNRIISFKAKKNGKIYPHTSRHKCNSRMVNLDIYQKSRGKLLEKERWIFNSAYNMGYKESEGRKKLVEDFKGFITEVWNSLEDDLTMDKTGESGYKDEKECIKAIKKYTLKIIKKKAKALNLLEAKKDGIRHNS